MSSEEVRAVIEAARTIDPLASVAFRLAAVAGLRRAELAALRLDDLDGDRLTVDSSASVVRVAGESPRVLDAPTKTANSRIVRLDRQNSVAAGCAAAGARRRPVYVQS